MNFIKQALTVREIRRKILCIILVVFMVRVLSIIPVPGIDSTVFKQWLESNSNDVTNLFAMFTGGSFERFSMFAVGITPVITASIVMQLLSSAIEPLGKMSSDGESGRKKYKTITNVLGVFLAISQSFFIALGFSKGGLITSTNNLPTALSIAIITISMTIGTVILMTIAETLTNHQMGNGTSILLMANIISVMPSQFKDLFSQLIKDKSKSETIAIVSVTVFMIILIMITIIYMSDGYHPMKIQYSQKLSQASAIADMGELPIKVGMSSVIPVIFASVAMSIPQMIAMITGKGYGSGYSKIFLNMLSQQKWFSDENPIYSFGILIYLMLIVFFSFYYLPIVFNAAEVSNNIREINAFVPGVKAGEDTEEYIQAISRRLNSIGVVMLIIVAVIPVLICGSLGIQTSLSGTSLIIVIGVAIEFMKNMKMDMAGRCYTGILK